MTRPVVIAHRGASGYLPEHTIEAYQLAIELGADFIEPDLVATADGVLVARHENELSHSTDVAAHARFADRRTRKRVDGAEREGWFSEDFTLAELRTLRAREPRPTVRPLSAMHDGRYLVPTFAEVLSLARAAGVGVYPETKSPSHFAHEGSRLDGSPIAISLGRALVDALLEARFTDPARIYIQSFEAGNLIELRHEILPAAGLQLPLVQLFGRPGAVVHDLAFASPLPRALAAALARPMPETCGREALALLAESHADAIGIPRMLASDEVLAHARAAGLAVHTYTWRAEDFDSPEACVAAVAEAYARGTGAVFIDHPDVGARARERVLAQGRIA
jgi:glycerophosphoryl diester phosphodiesterase